jgi:hypothetical protein
MDAEKRIGVGKEQAALEPAEDSGYGRRHAACNHQELNGLGESRPPASRKCGEQSGWQEGEWEMDQYWVKPPKPA